MNRTLYQFVFAATIAIFFYITNVHSFKPRVLGGRDAEENEVKYIVSIKCGKSYCGGGIIDKKFIVTAAHCIHLNETTGNLLQPFRILAATVTRKDYDEKSTIVIDVVRAFLPAVYSRRGMNDIAILELKESLDLENNKDRLQKLSLPEPSEFDSTLYPTYDDAEFKFAGYGRSQVDETTDENGTVHYRTSSGGRLKVANATVIDRATCQELLPKFPISDAHMCVSVIEDKQRIIPQGTCRGDSGSPAVLDDGTIIGLDSVGREYCNNNLKPSIFTRISSYIPFIKNVMQGNTDGIVVYNV